MLEGSLTLPPSKSYTHRAVLMASLARGTSTVGNPLFSRDTGATVSSCRAMGADIGDEDGRLAITGCGPSAAPSVVNAENSGTTLRFMTSAFALAPSGYTVLTGDGSVRSRPMQPLLDALGELGVSAISAPGNGRAPVVVKGGGMPGGRATMRGDVSSQFVSSLLISTPLARRDTDLLVTNPESKPYVDATLSMLRTFGVRVAAEGHTRFTVESGQSYTPATFEVPGDFSSAAFIMAAVAMLGGKVEISGVNPSLPQADSKMVDIVREMGCKVDGGDGRLTVESSGGGLGGGSFDLGDSPDLLPPLSVLALKCREPLEIRGVAHARFKETDRIAMLAMEISKLGPRVTEREDGMVIEPCRELRRASLDAHDDHRLFMAFCLVSMAVPGGCSVEGAESVDVSYPGFLGDMKKIGAEVVS